MAQGVVQPSFSSGEIAPALYGRVDFAKYYTGVKTARNFIVRRSGGLTNRPGTRLAAETKFSGAKKSRMIPFQFSPTQTYVLEFGDLYMRVISNGGYVLADGSAGVIGGYIISGPPPVEIATIYQAADLDEIKFVQDHDVMTLTHPNYPQQQLSRYSHTNWVIGAFSNVNGPFLDINIDQSKTISASGTDGSVTITSNSDIFESNMVGQLLYLEQNPDYTIPMWEVQISVAANSQIRAGSNYYMATTSGTTGTVRPDHAEGISYDGNPGVGWLYLHSGFGIVLITGFIDTKHVTATVLSKLPTSLVTASFTKSITGAVVVGSGDKVYVTCPGHGFSSGDSVTISGVTGMTELNGTWTLDKGDGYWTSGLLWDADHFFVAMTPANAYVSGGSAVKSALAMPAYKWALEAWGGDSGYPATVSFFQQREIFAGSAGKPQTFWMSASNGAYLEFGKSVPMVDTDALKYDLASKQLEEIRHAVDLTKLLLFTCTSVWIVAGNSDGVILPGAINAKRQVNDGSSHTPPLVIGSEALFITEKLNQIKAVGYSWQKDSYLSSDLTVMSEHLFEGHQVVNWAYQKTPFATVWAVRDDGVLLSLTYMPEQEVIGWCRHDTDGLYEDVVCVSEGNEDALYFQVLRTINGVPRRFVERAAMRKIFDVKDAFFVDCGLSYSGPPATAFSGLSHLEGKTVSILADGIVEAQQVVTGGAVTLSRAYSTVHIGLPFQSDIETLDMSVPGSDLVIKQKIVHQVTALVQETVGLLAGPDLDHLDMMRQDRDFYDEPVNMLTDQVQVRIDTSWSKGGSVCISQQDPLPITVLALVPEVTAGGS
jgi:hypothetical protein